MSRKMSWRRKDLRLGARYYGRRTLGAMRRALEMENQARDWDGIVELIRRKMARTPDQEDTLRFAEQQAQAFRDRSDDDVQDVYNFARMAFTNAIDSERS